MVGDVFDEGNGEDRASDVLGVGFAVDGAGSFVDRFEGGGSVRGNLSKER